MDKYIIFFMLFSVILFILLYYIKNKINYKKNLNSIIKDVESFYNEFEKLYNSFICYSDYIKIKKQYENLYSKTKKSNKEFLIKFNKDYKDLKNFISKKNDDYVIREKKFNQEYFDDIFGYPLDEEQRNAIVIDDNNNLVIAGAGSGKTSTMVAKIKYLIEKKNVDPTSIIAISFTNEAVIGFRKKLDNKDVSCTTFHKLGLNILSKDKKRDIASDLLNETINKYIVNDIIKKENEIDGFVKFMTLYLHVPCSRDDKSMGEIFEHEKGFDLETVKSKVLQRQNKLTTLKFEEVKSYEELAIANYLYINGIEYEYERSYEYDVADINHRQYHPDFYFPKYNIYYEHFGINRENRAPQYNTYEENRYIEGINVKRFIHKEKKTKLIETYSYYFSEGIIFDELDKLLKSNGIEYKPLDSKEIYDALINQKFTFELDAFKSLIQKFISLFKGSNYQLSKFSEFKKDASNKNDKRSIILLDILEKVYLKYQEDLKRNKQIDFDDMINLATKEVENDKFIEKINYIIIDEFQDISFSRYMLIKRIQEKTNCKVIAVGDDWQSIFKFSGSSIDMLVNFEKYFPFPQIMYINNTHRNGQQLIDIAGNFIMENKNGQIAKNLKSNKNLELPINIYYYKDNILKATKDAITELEKFGCKDIAIIGRNRSDLNNYVSVNNFKVPYDLSRVFNKNIVFNTAHSSKGLEYDGVIICNLKNSLAGFPNKMADDPILNYVSLLTEIYPFEEERRLLYVALTRTKSKCALLVPSGSPSMFIRELVDKNENEISITISQDDEMLHSPNCPICQTGKLLIRTNKFDNSSFISCSNYPRCGFKNKSLDIVKNTVRCPRCNGFLVKKKGLRGYFYGCTNFPDCRQTAELQSIKIE